jgi:hypothetical protein
MCQANVGQIPGCDVERITMNKRLDHAIEVMSIVTPSIKAPYQMNHEPKKSYQLGESSS